MAPCAARLHGTESPCAGCQDSLPVSCMFAYHFFDLSQLVSLPTRLASPGSDLLISHLIYSSWLLCSSASYHCDKIPQMNNLRGEGSFWAHSFRGSVPGTWSHHFGREVRVNITVESETELSSTWYLESRELERSRRGIEDSTRPYKRAHSESAKG